MGTAGAVGVVYTTSSTQSTDASGQVLPAGQAATPTYFLTDPFRDGLSAPPGRALGADTALGQSRTLMEWNRRTSYLHQYNLVIQRLLPSNLVLDIAYVGSHGVRLPFPQLNMNQLPSSFLEYGLLNYATGRDANGKVATSAANFFAQLVTNPFYCIITTPNSTLSSRTVRRDQLLKPFPQYDNPILNQPLVGASKYNALQVSLRKTYSNGLSALASYSFSKLIDVGCSGFTDLACGGTRLEDIYYVASDYTISDIDIPQRFTASFSYEMPFGRSWGGLFAQQQLVASHEPRSTQEFLRCAAIYQNRMRSFTPEGTSQAVAERSPYVGDLGTTIAYWVKTFGVDGRHDAPGASQYQLAKKLPLGRKR